MCYLSATDMESNLRVPYFRLKSSLAVGSSATGDEWRS